MKPVSRSFAAALAVAFCIARMAFSQNWPTPYPAAAASAESAQHIQRVENALKVPLSSRATPMQPTT
jgi:hypothetical protein